MRESKPCEHCSRRFDRHPNYSHKQWAAQRYCSRKCRDDASRRDERLRFETFFDRGDPDSCWEWKGGRHGKGYGQFGYRPSEKAHRVAWRLYRGPIPAGLHVLHSCDNPPCVNPDHLFLGTNLDNVQDKIAKGRARYSSGEATGSARLTADQVRQILNDDRVQAVIAAEYDVATSTISAIKTGRNWRCLRG